MNQGLPAADDGKLWDLHFSSFAALAMTTADELRLFDELAKEPGTPEELAPRLEINRRAARALLGLLATTGLLVQHDGRYHVSETARTYLLRSSPFYWGPVLSLMRRLEISPASVLASVKAPETSSHWTRSDGDKPIDAWSGGNIGPELARDVAAYMNANALPAATVLARRFDLSRSKRLLDVGAGSGCFSIALAQANPGLRCTLMDLKSMCDVALEYVRAAAVATQIDAYPLDMFRQKWPTGYDVMFLSNILHDWDFETATMLLQRAFDALEPGGQVLIHEMLLDDSHDGPATAAAFSFYMLIGTKGQQFTATELISMLGNVGFRDPKVTPAHGYYAVVSGRK